MEGAPEMQNFGPTFATTGRHVFAHFPIHRRFQRVLDRERATLDQKVTIKRRESGHARKRVDKFGITFRINIGVCDFEFGCAQQVFFHGGLIEIGMIEPNGKRAEKSVEIDQPPIRCFIV